MGMIDRHADVTASTHRSMEMQITTTITANSVKLKPLSDEQLRRCTNKELRVCLRNAQRRGFLDQARRTVKLMHARGIAKSKDFDNLRWNDDTVRDLLRPFREVAEAVGGRRAYVPVGGFPHRAKSDPSKLWIDQYCAMKTPTTNAVIACRVKKPGDEPTFVLQINGAIYETYGLDRYDHALRKWRELGGSPPPPQRIPSLRAPRCPDGDRLAGDPAFSEPFGQTG
jgi:hypothetical protein